MKTKIHAFPSCVLVVACLWLVSVSMAAIPAQAKAQIDLNTATEKELITLPGVGASTARSIIAARPFKTVEDLQKVKGIGKARYDAIKGMVTIKNTAEIKPVPDAKGLTRPATKAGLININAADQKTLAALPGIGATTAKNIVAARPFKSVEDLKKVKGIEKANYNAIKDLVTAAQIDINTADQKTLETLPRIGASTARSIIAARPFKSVQDLQNVKGIGKANFETLKDMVTVGGVGRAKILPAPKETTTAVESEEKRALAPQPSDLAAEKATPVGLININTADQKTLEALPGIGPVKAQAIIANRPYAKVEDIMKVTGIKEGIFAKIKDQIVVQ